MHVLRIEILHEPHGTKRERDGELYRIEVTSAKKALHPYSTVLVLLRRDQVSERPRSSIGLDAVRAMVHSERPRLYE